MASRTLFPPIVNSYEPAFVAGSSSSLKVYFSLSSLSSIPADTTLTVHAQVYRQDGVRVINTDNDAANGRYRATGIILNLTPVKSDIKKNYYYVIINNSDLKSSVTLNGSTYNGWIPGWVYKIQLRLSTVTYDPKTYPRQSAWLQEFSNHFSEWSTICYTKAIASMRMQIPLFTYDSADLHGYNPNSIYSLNEMNFFGTLENTIPESNEYFDNVTISLYDQDKLLEESGEIHRVEQSSSYFSYKFKTKFVEGTIYTLYINYITENQYMPPSPTKFNFTLSEVTLPLVNARVITVDYDAHPDIMEEITSLDIEEDEGRVALKIYSPDTSEWSGNLCISRASQKDNFQTWEDIKIIVVKQKDLNTLDLIYDYTIESGVWYKYGLQSIAKDGVRSKLFEMHLPIQRLFNYSYLVGRDGKQLKLPFNNEISSFRHQLYESKTDTIGSKYPFITRNARVDYRTFPLTALISFNMDDNNTFLTKGKKDLYHYKAIVDLYDQYVADSGRYIYDYTYEKDFREVVLDFLQDGKPKLFKSPTEGNIIVRLTDVNCSPERTLDRMIYSLSMNADEIDDNTLENYIKYGFLNVGAYATDFSVHGLYIGQIDGDFYPTDNIFRKIYEKYDSQGRNYGGYSRELKSIQRVKITINGYTCYRNSDNRTFFVPGHQLRVYNNQHTLVLGNNLKLNYSNGVGEQIITNYSPRGIYEFDNLLKFYYTRSAAGNDSLFLLGDAEGSVVSINATIDFIYELSTEPYEAHEILERHSIKNIAQIYEEIKPDTSIYNMIYYKHYFDSDTVFKYLSSISSIEIEANPHTIFAIQGETDDDIHYYEINETGVLSFYELTDIMKLKYIGKRYLKTPYNESTLSEEILTEDVLGDDNHYIIKGAADVSITYIYNDFQGVYKQKS